MSLVQSVDRVLRILDLFDEYKTELRISEISKLTQLNKSTVYALLKTLQNHNYIEQDTDTKKYRLGVKLFERGNYVIHNLDLRVVVRDHLLDLAIKTNYTLHLVIRDNKAGPYDDRGEGKSAHVCYCRKGRRVPPHSSSIRKILTAFKKEQEFRNLIEYYDYETETDKTKTHVVNLMEQLARVKENDYAGHQ